jgi:dephospho-CoA kinase
MHPLVQRRRDQLIAEAGARGDRVVVSDIPLLFEAADPAAFDRVVLVDAPTELRLRRLIAARGFSETEARALIATQWPAERKRAWRGPGGRAPIVIDNDGDLAALERRAKEAWEKMTAD